MSSLAPSPALDLPVIDIRALAGPHAHPGAAAAAHALGRAAREVGFFYVAGHGIGRDELAAWFDASRRFFALPQAEKDALSIARSRGNRGYVRLSGENLDPGSGEPDHKEAFNIGLELAPDDPELTQPELLRSPNQWPGLPGWRDTFLGAFDRLLAIGRTVHRGFARDLDLAPSHFDAVLDHPMATLRLLRYPARRPGGEARLGAGAHTDYGNLTLLATNGVAGLQVRRRDGLWLDAPQVEGALICNIGDCLMRWSNDVYVSTPHRVRAPAAERHSIAFFLDPNPDAVVACLPGCVAEGEPPKYSAIRAADYLRMRLDATHQPAER